MVMMCLWVKQIQSDACLKLIFSTRTRFDPLTKTLLRLKGDEYDASALNRSRDRALTQLQRRLELAQTEKAGIQLNGLRYNAVPSPPTCLFPPPKSDVSSTKLEELFKEHKTEKLKDKSNEVEPESVRKNSDAPIIEDWVSDDEEEKVEKQKVKPSINRINFVKATTDNNPRETVKNGEQPKQNTHRKRGDTNFSHLPRSGEDRLKLKKLMELCTKLSDRVLDLEKTKTREHSVSQLSHTLSATIAVTATATMTTVVPTSEEDPALAVVRFTAEMSWAEAGPEVQSLNPNQFIM
nr:eukaryotic translation initiation factor 3 subunit M-like [Tanacetum cinerariifolium]